MALVIALHVNMELTITAESYFKLAADLSQQCKMFKLIMLSRGRTLIFCKYMFLIRLQLIGSEKASAQYRTYIFYDVLFFYQLVERFLL